MAGMVFFAISEDYGEHFHYEEIPVFVHGNLNGRGTADRLWVDQEDANTLYYASQQDGLLLTHDQGHTWSKSDTTVRKISDLCYAGREQQWL